MDGKYTKLNMLDVALTIMLLLGSGLKASVPVDDDSVIVASPYYYLMTPGIRKLTWPVEKDKVPVDPKEKLAYEMQREADKTAYIKTRIDEAKTVEGLNAIAADMLTTQSFITTFNAVVDLYSKSDIIEIKDEIFDGIR